MFFKICVYNIYFKPSFRSIEWKFGLSWVLRGLHLPNNSGVPDTSAFSICQEKKRPTLGRLRRACCTVQNWKKRPELIKGNVGWLDNLKISLIMCKLSKRSIWCHCRTNRKDLTDVVFWHLCPLTYGPGATNPALRESENYLWHKPKNFGPLWKVPEKP